jgi:hypothetical protein
MPTTTPIPRPTIPLPTTPKSLIPIYGCSTRPESAVMPTTCRIETSSPCRTKARVPGEISADRHWSLVADVVRAMGLPRVIGGQTVDADCVRQVIETLVLPAARTATTGQDVNNTAKPGADLRNTYADPGHKSA